MAARAALVILVILVFVAACRSALAQPADVNRVLRSFDFEERRLGNVEDLPMNWSKVAGPGLPHYVNGRLTTDRARSGQYSFRLDLNGGSLTYRYQSGQVKVQRDAHYQVDAFVQTTPMQHARARVTAYFTDLDGHPIIASIRQSELYAANNGEVNQWKPLSIELTASDEKAAFLVIEIGLLNPAAYSPAVLGQRTLFPQDIQGTAWFDDIVVSQVPQVTMGTQRPGNIFRRLDPLRLIVGVNDRFTDDLSAQLVVRDAADRVVYQKSGALDMSAAQTPGPGQKRMILGLPDALAPGWYQASLEMRSQRRFVGRQTLDFVLLADDGQPVAPDPRFGLVATDLPFEGWSELPDILPLLAAGRVKLGVWCDQGDIQQADGPGFDRLLERLQSLQITPTACLLSLPPAVRDKIRAARAAPMGMSESESPFGGQETLDILRAAKNSWLQILKAPSDTWQPQLAYLLARHANHLDRWQLGDDGSDAFVNMPEMRDVYRRVYAEFATLVQKPDLAMPWPAWYELEGDAPATVALHVKPDVLPSQLPLYLSGLDSKAKGQATSNLSVYLESLQPDEYGRQMQIRDLAQRVCYALAADAKRIDIKLPFTVARRDGSDELARRPQEMFLVVRTLMMMLSNASFKGRVPIADDVEAFLFDRNGQGVLMLWNRGNETSVKQLALNSGPRAACVDLWGNVTPLLGRKTETEKNRDGSYFSSAGSSVSLEVGPTPIFLTGIDAQLAQLRASVGLDNDHIESSFKPHTRRLRFTNPYRSAIAGTVRLTPPKGWNINPPTQTFALNPGETFDREVRIEFPYNSFAGPKTITAEFQVQAENNVSFVVPLVLKLGLSDVGLQTIALRDGRDVIVQQMITNYGEQPIDYTAYAIYPGQARQERLVTKLAPGRTTIKKYRFAGVSVVPDARVRSGVRELLGTRVLNDEVAIQ
jgi:hypothetical protein